MTKVEEVLVRFVEQHIVLDLFHLEPEDEIKYLKASLQQILLAHNITQLNEPVMLETYPCKVSGNSQGIVNSFITYLYRRNWRQIDYNEFLKLQGTCDALYRRNNRGYVEEVKLDTTVPNVKERVTFGYGAYQRITETSMSFYTDDKNNLLYDVNVSTYD